MMIFVAQMMLVLGYVEHHHKLKALVMERLLALTNQGGFFTGFAEIGGPAQVKQMKPREVGGHELGHAIEQVLLNLNNADYNTWLEENGNPVKNYLGEIEGYETDFAKAIGKQIFNEYGANKENALEVSDRIFENNLEDRKFEYSRKLYEEFKKKQEGKKEEQEN